MKWRIIILTVCVLMGASQLNGQQGDEALKKLEGKYTLIKGEADGKDMPEEALKDSLLVLAGNKHTVKVGATKIVGTHAVDATKKPKTIDATDTEGPFKDKTVFGIYTIEGDTFSVCFAPPGKDRPTEFTTKSGTGVIYHVWKRQKE